MVKSVRVQQVRPFVLVVVCLLVLGLASLVVQLELPAATGAYLVGRATWRWVDRSRPEAMTTDSDDLREVVAEVWYPAQPGTGAPAAYIPDLNRLERGLVEGGEISAVAVYAMRYVRTRDYANAQVNSTQASYPVLLLSPGNQTNVEFYAALADELASHGYIVVGVNHPYDVAAVALSDGTIAQFNPNQWPTAPGTRQAFVAERVEVRKRDLQFVLDQLDALNRGSGSLLSGRLDLSRVGALGHSLGGITAAQAALTDTRVKAYLNIDGLQAGGPFSVRPNGALPLQPFMFITKETQLPESLLAQLRSTAGGSYRVVIPGASHEDFTDGALLQPSLLPLPGDADAVLSVTRAYTRAFFDQTLRAMPSTLLATPVHSQQLIYESFPAR